MKAVQMRYLLAFVRQQGNKQNQTAAARICGVNKSTINRTLADALSEGIMVLIDGEYLLTGYGKELVDEYEDSLELITCMLRHNGINTEQAREDSFGLVAGCSNNTLEMLKAKGRRARLFEKLNEQNDILEINPHTLSRYMEETEYPLAFSFYHISEKNYNPIKVSMANEAFYHPAVISTVSGNRFICLNIRTMCQKSQVNNESMEGQLKKMTYQADDKEHTVLMNAGKVYIPIEALNVSYISQDAVLRLYMEVKVTCTVGQLHMPESRALFVARI